MNQTSVSVVRVASAIAKIAANKLLKSFVFAHYALIIIKRVDW